VWLQPTSTIPAGALALVLVVLILMKVVFDFRGDHHGSAADELILCSTHTFSHPISFSNSWFGRSSDSFSSISIPLSASGCHILPYPSIVHPLKSTKCTSSICTCVVCSLSSYNRLTDKIKAIVSSHSSQFQRFYTIERIRAPKQKQVQFLFLTLGCCTAAVHLQHAPSKGRWVLNLYIILDESACFCHLVGLTEPRCTHPATQCRPRLRNKN
jgi:hypothetical protein